MTTQVTVSYGPENAGATVRLYASLLTGAPAEIPFNSLNSEKWALQSDGFVLAGEGRLDINGKITFKWQGGGEVESRLQSVISVPGGWMISNPLSYGEAAGEAPTIAEQPVGGGYNGFDPVEMTVTATGTEPLTYQWYIGESGNTSSPIGGATEATIAVEPFEDTNYWVRVTNDFGSVDSNTAAVWVEAAA